MKKLRSDSTWSSLSTEQRTKLHEWLFDQNVTYSEALKRAKKEFGVAASIASLARYYKYAASERRLERLTEVKAMSRKVTGAEPGKENVEDAAVALLQLSAYELALAEPEKLKLEELSWLMKTLQQHRRQKVAERLCQVREFKSQVRALRQVTRDLNERNKNKTSSPEEMVDMLHYFRREMFNEGPDGVKLPPRSPVPPAATADDAKSESGEEPKSDAQET